MKTFETKHIVDDLFEVTIDGVKRPVPYTMEQIGELYEMLWREEQNEKEVQA